MTDIKLRPYQQDFIDNVRNEFLHNHKRVVGVAPCGAGKTIMTGWMIKQAYERGKRSIFFVHRQELIEQTAKTFFDLDIPFGIIKSGTPMNLNLPVQIASVQTLAKRLDYVNDNFIPDFLICDECHHILATTYKKILDKFPQAYLLGVTATPQRIGGKTLCDVFSSMVLAPSVNQLIKLGNLTSFEYFNEPLDIDLSKCRIKNGDYVSNDLETVMDDKRIIGDIVEHYLHFAYGKSTICYCVNVNHSKTIADAFNDAGIPAAHCDGDTPKDLRAAIVNNFRNGITKVLCNAELFGEGFDVPRCEAVILARPTQSLTLYIQQSMRPMRPDPDNPDKVAVIIDCVKNKNRHGLPNSFHDWSLDPNTKKPTLCFNCGKNVVPDFVRNDDGDIIKIKLDDKNQPIKDEHGKIRNFDDGERRKQCPKCGYIFPLIKEAEYRPRRIEIDEDNFLSQLNISFEDTHVSEQIIHKPTTPEELMLIAQQKKYKRGWVAFNALEFATSFEDCLHIAEVCEYDKGWAWYSWQDIKNSKEA